MVLLHSEMVPLGTSAQDFDLKGIDGEKHSLSEYSDAKALVMVFMCNHCPYVQAVWERMIDLAGRMKDKGVQFVGINANGANLEYEEDSYEKMSEYAKDKGHNFPYLFDADQSVAREYNAVCTPDFFVYDQDRKLVYRGRLDDNWKEPEEVTSHDLEDALEAILANKKPTEDQYPSMGCSIKWLD